MTDTPNPHMRHMQAANAHRQSAQDQRDMTATRDPEEGSGHAAASRAHTAAADAHEDAHEQDMATSGGAAEADRAAWRASTHAQAASDAADRGDAQEAAHHATAANHEAQRAISA